MKEQKIISERDTLTSTGKSLNLLLELVILILHPNNLTSGTINIIIDI